MLLPKYSYAYKLLLLCKVKPFYMNAPLTITLKPQFVQMGENNISFFWSQQYLSDGLQKTLFSSEIYFLDNVFTERIHIISKNNKSIMNIKRTSKKKN